jgi:PII-like signaling protein
MIGVAEAAMQTHIPGSGLHDRTTDHTLVGDRVLLRLHVSEAARHRHQLVYEAVVELLRARGIAGATVLRAIMGFGRRRVVHGPMNEIASISMPVVVECVDDAERVAAVLPELDAIIESGLITLERARVIVYRDNEPAPRPEEPMSENALPSHRAATDPVDVATAHVHGMKGERTLMRIHIGESDRHEGQPLYAAIVQLLRERHYAGATVFRAVLGFGAHARVHRQKMLQLSSDLPIVVECIETEERIAAILPELDRMIGGGLVTLERVRVIMYRPDLQASGRSGTWTTDVTGRWQPDDPKSGH